MRDGHPNNGSTDQPSMCGGRFARRLERGDKKLPADLNLRSPAGLTSVLYTKARSGCNGELPRSIALLPKG